ncbi:MAG: AMP-binding protein [Acidimicrobiales bacterium]
MGDDRRGPTEFNLAAVQETLAEAIADRDAIVSAAGRLTWGELTERTRRLANCFLDRGLTVARERPALGDYECGQDRVAVLLYSRPEYIETMLGAFKARLAPCNVNYRYVASELISLFADMAPAAVVYEAPFAEVLDQALDRPGPRPLLLEVGSAGGRVSLPGAIAYEDALAGSSSSRPTVAWSPDDLYLLYTGGTTGAPKGVLWRQADIFVAALGGRNYREGARDWGSLEELRTAVAGREGVRALSAAPFMHGTGQWIAFQALHAGGAVVIPHVVERFDADDVLDTVAREHVGLLAIAGESFAQPLLDALDAKQRDLSSLRMLVTSGAALTPGSKKRLTDHLADLRIRDTVGSSEAGPIAQIVSSGASAGEQTRFAAGDGALVVDENRERLLAPGHPGTGWLARGGRIPLGYLNDPDKTRETFRVIDGRRVSIPGDRARIEADGTIEVLGRDSVTINSGGEKIFAEEVESALLQHPDIRDVIVIGRPSDRWGSEVVALIETRDGRPLETEGVRELCRRHIARYKVPKQLIFVDHVARNPAGKANYTWARRVAGDAATSTPAGDR